MRALLLLLFLLVAVPARADELRVGAATVVITPPAGTPMAGYYYERAAEGVHDDLYARALVLEVGGTRAALVALDLISTPPAVVREARRAIERTTRLRGEDVLISATHAHTGPVLGGRTRREKALGGTSDLARRYTEELPGKIARAVCRAEEALTPARAWVGHGKEETLAHNRRYHMKDGNVGWNPGLLNPNILKPAGPIDPDVAVVYFETRGKKPLAIYVNYAVHLDNTGGTKISADLPYTLTRLLTEVKGPEMVTVYTTGCCGDVNQLNVAWGERQQGFETAARMGIVLAGEVLRTLPRLKPVEAGALRIKREVVRLPLPKVEPGEVEKVNAVLQRKGGPGGRASFLETVQAYKVLDVAAREGKPLEAEVQVIAWGEDLAWVALPGEIFVELGLTIKQDSPFKHTVIAELANGSVGYVPARRAYAQGNYEVVSARCAEGSGELLADTAVRLLKELYRANSRSR
jgi:hypothetical protein